MATKVVERQVTHLGIVAPPPILVQTPAFEGTLATLFRCVRDQRVDLMLIPLEPICEAYFLYLLENEETDLDEAAAALTVLAYLLERKTKLLLPPDEDELEEEIERGLEGIDPTLYAYEEIIQALTSGQDERSKMFFRTAVADAGQYEVPFEIGNVTVKDLARALERVLRRATPETVEMVSKPRRSLQEQMKLVLATLKPDFQTLEQMIVGAYTRAEVVYWFLALLELIRLDRAIVKIEFEEVSFARK